MFAGMPGYLVQGTFPESPPLDNRTILLIVKLLLILGALFLLDILTTQIILLRGGIELNPIMMGVVANPALHLVIKTAVLLIIFSVSLIAEQRVKGSSAVFYGVLILLYSAVVLNNLVFILPRIPM
jgi:hypothetical protein